MRRDRVELAAMLAPYLVGLGGLVFFPAVVTLWLAFTEYDLLRSPDWIGLGNFRELWHDDSSAAYFGRQEPTLLTATVAYRTVAGERRKHTITHDLSIYRDLAYVPEGEPDV
jgi:ABC-type sugar transport system permease subunit